MISNATLDVILVVAGGIGLGFLFLGIYVSLRNKQGGGSTVGVVLAGLVVLGIYAAAAVFVFKNGGIAQLIAAEPPPRNIPAPVSTPMPTPTPTLEPGWTLHEYPDDGFAIALPSSWVEIDEEEEDLDLGDEVEGFHEWASIDSVEGELAFMSVIVARMYMEEAMTLDEILELEEFDPEKLTSRERVDLPVGEAEKVQRYWIDDYGEKADMTIYLSVQGEYLYAVFFAYSDPELVDQNAATVEKIMQSFRIIGETIATATPEAGPLSPSCMPGATFVSDVTTPDGTAFAPGESFSKIWRIRSDGCAPWPAGTRIAFNSGDQMGGPDTKVLETPLGDTADVSVELTAPANPGTYKGYWQLEASDGTRFGDRFYVLITVR